MTPGAPFKEPVAVIGAGAIGQTVGHLLARAGYPVIVSWSSNEQRLRHAAENIGFGARPATPADAVAQASTVIFAPVSSTSTPPAAPRGISPTRS